MVKKFVLRRKEIIINEGMGPVHEILSSYYGALKDTLKKFARIMERDLRDECIEIWYGLVSRILSIAEDNKATGVAEFLGTYTYAEVSDGKFECSL